MERIEAEGIIERIKIRRQALGYSYQRLSDETGISKSTLQRYETGAIKNIPLDKLETLADGLHTTLSYLMGWDDDPIDYDNIDDIYVPTEFKKLGMGVKDYLKFNEAVAQDYIVENTNGNLENEIENPDIRMIARAGKKMTAKQAELLRKYAEFTFPEAFKKDGD